MIPVTPKPEYTEFDNQVRRPGLAFLKKTPKPTSADFKKHGYWRRAMPHLRAAFSSACAYTTCHMVDGGTIDHFLPKTLCPHLAYEWENYRLARQKMNQRKGDTTEVVDPFTIKTGWFVLDFPSCLVRPGRELSVVLRKRINSTINILQLNTDDSMVQERCNLLVELADGNVTMEFLDKFYPFLSSEVRRQDIEGDLRVIFSRTTRLAN